MIVLYLTLLKKMKINGITLFPFIILRDKNLRKDKVLMNHEKIHIYQQLELLIVFFYIWYVIEYYYWLWKLNDKHLAYHNICFAREAYAQEEDLNYLQKRRIWSFWKYRI